MVFDWILWQVFNCIVLCGIWLNCMSGISFVILCGIWWAELFGRYFIALYCVVFYGLNCMTGISLHNILWYLIEFHCIVPIIYDILCRCGACVQLTYQGRTVVVNVVDRLLSLFVYVFVIVNVIVNVFGPWFLNSFLFYFCCYFYIFHFVVSHGFVRVVCIFLSDVICCSSFFSHLTCVLGVSDAVQEHLTWDILPGTLSQGGNHQVILHAIEQDDYHCQMNNR